MNDFQFKSELERIFNPNQTNHCKQPFFSVEDKYRKHFVKLLHAGIKAPKAIQIIRQAAAFSIAFPDDLQEKYMFSVVEIITKN